MPQVRTRLRAQIYSDAEEDVEEERPHGRKRIRVSRACDECRRRKDRCDGRQPTCRPCTEGGRKCIYNPTKKRGLPPGYVRAVELVLGLVFRSIEGSESSISALLRGEVEEPRSDASSASTAGGSTPIECLLDTWRQSKVLKEVEKMLLADSPDNESSGRTVDEIFAVAFSAVTAQDKAGASQLLPSPDAHFPPVIAPPVRERGVPSPTVTTIHKDHAAPIPSNWFSLLDLYFAITHCWFPIAQKHECLRVAHLLADTSDAQRQDSVIHGERAFLWAIFAYTSHQCSALGIASDSSEDLVQDDCRSPQYLQMEAESLATWDQTQRDIGHVRAFLLLALLKVGCQCWSKAWSFVGQAVYLAIDLGYTSRTAGFDEDETRTVLGCFVLETLIAAKLGRRPYLRRSDMHSATLQTNGIDEWEVWQPSPLSKTALNIYKMHEYSPGYVLSIFNHLCGLVAVLNDIISQPHGQTSRRILVSATWDLDRWREQLPRHCRDPLDGKLRSDVAVSPQLLNLCIAFASISVLLKNRTVAISDTTIQAPDTTSKLSKTLNFAGSQLQEFGAHHTPAIFELHVSSFGASSSARSTSLNDELAYYESFSENLKAVLHKTWRRGRSSENGLAGHPSRNRIALSRDAITVPPYERSMSALTPQSAPQAEGSTAVQQFYASSPPRENNDDTLFNSLTLLDPIDWSANPPEFMERLGLPAGIVPADYESLFNPPNGHS